MTITAGDYDFTIYQGRTFSTVLTWKDQNNNPVNLTGYSARLQARASTDAASTIVDLSNPSGGISLGGAAGTITLSMSEAATGALTADKAIYDLKVTDSLGTSNTLLRGTVFITKRVTA